MRSKRGNRVYFISVDCTDVDTCTISVLALSFTETCRLGAIELRLALGLVPTSVQTRISRHFTFVLS